MATVMQMHWPEVTRDLYEAARKAVGWEVDAPKGGKYHVAWFGTDGFHVLDVWDSIQEFTTFAETRLMPAVAKLGIKGQPNIQFSEAVATFAPNP